ncbi:RSP_2648 family PIN domain-containing protein [Pelagovum pacificum]|uniref:PIN domain-containing protein n=1 Tax=Pelagovum pacificum TaxID=2588711 RepID=A0A5C5GCR4_9RHOB|nr:PIN domain-containing protein [Pelagovum pacificum]QQA44424.1 PIN domain-containing protein [Pelagovum pacificum]TNY32458.1 PIN domain-containing protein [Pelagovum pacificum]
MSGPRLLVDACVLYPTVMREVVLGVAAEGLFDPRWSTRLLEEWARAARKLGPAGEEQARAEVAQVRARFPAAEIAVPDGLERRLWLPDPDDIHVLATAIGGSCDGIMTVNAKDFPRGLLAEEGLERVDPDGFLMTCFAEAPDRVARVGAAVLDEARRLSGEAWEMRGLMRKARLPRLGKALAGAGTT